MRVRSLLVLGALLLCGAAAHPSPGQGIGRNITSGPHPKVPSIGAGLPRRGTPVGGIDDHQAISRKLKADNWRIEGDPEAVRAVPFGKLLEARVPGHTRLYFFLDHGRFYGSIQDMRVAWRGRPMGEAPTSPAHLDAFFEAQSGQTVIVVGHVEGGFFRPDYGKGPRVGLGDMAAAAERHRVLLIPIGCQTCEAGVPIGFNGPVSTKSVAEFLGSLPDNPRLADFLTGMAKIGDLTIKVDELFMSSRNTSPGLSVSVESSAHGDVLTYFRIPGDLLDQQDPELDRSIVRDTFLFLRSPELQYARFAAVLALLAFPARRGLRLWMRSGWLFRRRGRSVVLPIAIAANSLLRRLCKAQIMLYSTFACLTCLVSLIEVREIFVSKEFYLQAIGCSIAAGILKLFSISKDFFKAWWGRTGGGFGVQKSGASPD